MFNEVSNEKELRRMKESAFQEYIVKQKLAYICTIHARHSYKGLPNSNPYPKPDPNSNPGKYKKTVCLRETAGCGSK